MAVTITVMPTPVFPTSAANIVSFDSLITQKTNQKFMTNNWQLFGGNYLLQTNSNDMIFG